MFGSDGEVSEDYYDQLFQFYEDDIVKSELLAQHQTFHLNFKVDPSNVYPLVNMMNDMSGAE